MSDVLVIFGSESDKAVYHAVTNELKRQKVDFTLRVSSAHKSPDDVDETLQQEYKIIIAGAGLAAHLPGVVAAKVLSPVIGVPCKGNFEGMDALLSIVQMPPGVPVMGVGVDQGTVAAQQAALMLKPYKDVTIVGSEDDRAVQKCMAVLKEFDVPFSICEKTKAESVNIEFTAFDEPMTPKDHLVVYCFTRLKDDDMAQAALSLLKHTDHGVWVGMNNGMNAALAATQILNREGKYTEVLQQHREQNKNAVLSANKGEHHD